jgi:hypothetical protein
VLHAIRRPGSMRYTFHGGGPCEGALNGAVMPGPVPSGSAGQPWSAHAFAIRASAPGRPVPAGVDGGAACRAGTGRPGVGAHITSDLNPNATVNAWGGPTYTGAVMAHWLDRISGFYAAAFLLSRLLLPASLPGFAFSSARRRLRDGLIPVGDELGQLLASVSALLAGGCRAGSRR